MLPSLHASVESIYRRVQIERAFLFDIADIVPNSVEQSSAYQITVEHNWIAS